MACDKPYHTETTPEIPPDIDPDWIERARAAGCEFLPVANTWTVRHDRMEIVSGAMSITEAARAACEALGLGEAD
jgi:hypothetical protein